MKQFITKYAPLITGVLSGFDRLVFRGGLKVVSNLRGMSHYLYQTGLMLKDYTKHVEAMSKRIKETTIALANARGIADVYLKSPSENKEARARQIAAERGIKEGPICILSSVEMCHTFFVRGNRISKTIELVSGWRRCLFFYHYMIHPVFGFMNARIQTWMPFPIQICINGREWLSRQLDAAQIGYVRRENCFTWVEDTIRAQQLLDKQLKVSWPKLFGEIAVELNPIHDELFKDFPTSYYWCVFESEWATDVMFRTPEDLARLYSRFIHHGITSFFSPDIMRFLGRKSPNEGMVHPAFKGETISTVKHRPEGVRIKHSVNGNSIKLYDKQGSVLRVETTINNPRDLRVFRPKRGRPCKHTWQRMRKGAADLHRRVQLCQAANERYLDALAAVASDATLEELTKDICRPVIFQNKRFRAIHTWDPDELHLLKTIAGGEFFITGFRNRDIARLLFPQNCASKEERKRISAAVSYRLRILRAHGLILKVHRSHRYFVTKKGRAAITALLSAQQATITKLTEAVA
ncbi:hypothetical protein HZA56_01360 [Candidatus Poribacteria bacterium]|nr:hypothetical protein [Candidatus Poribacteria bacterium]